MNFAPTLPLPPRLTGADSQAMLARLIGNLSGFAYRRRHDARWTMEYVSEGCRDVTGYDPHRLIGNASLAFGTLIARSDRARVNERVRLAARLRQRITLEYRILAAHGALVRVEDRLTPIVDATGKVVAVEGIIDRARRDPAPPGFPSSLAARRAAIPRPATS
jgi:PAS domain S-box-containing protein